MANIENDARVIAFLLERSYSRPMPLTYPIASTTFMKRLSLRKCYTDRAWLSDSTVASAAKNALFRRLSRRFASFCLADGESG